MSPLVATRAGATARGYGWTLAAAGPIGAFESIATVTATGGETSLSFTSIPQNYVALQIRGLYRDTTTSPYQMRAMFRFNSDTGNNYASHALYGNGTSVSAWGQTVTSVLYTWLSGQTSDGSNTLAYAPSIVDIENYSSTATNKTVRYIAGSDRNVADNIYGIAIGSGAWLSTSAITSITCMSYATSFASGTTFALYGIKGAA